MLYPLKGGTECFTRLRGTDSESEEGGEHGVHNAPRAWRVDGRVSVCACQDGSVQSGA